MNFTPHCASFVRRFMVASSTIPVIKPTGTEAVMAIYLANARSNAQLLWTGVRPYARLILTVCALVLWALSAFQVSAAPYAALVMDARSGKVLFARNANTQLHPASLTKMMTLYVAFQAVENNEISLDTLVTVSRKAAGEEPSRLGLRTGQKIKLRYLIRAAAVKSANDAATALAEAISGSEAAFARRMNRVAQQMGMTRTKFRNAHGLTEKGHLSTARDMTALGRHLIYDYPQYYNLFSRLTADAGVRNVSHTNRRLLNSYRGADGIKTGYTRAAGFNLVASAERGQERVIATVFGGRSVTWRNAKVAELLDLGFRRAPSKVARSMPSKPAYLGRDGGGGTTRITNASPDPGRVGRATRSARAAVTRSLRPVRRGGEDVSPTIGQEKMNDLLAEAQLMEVASKPPAPQIRALDLSLESTADTDLEPEPQVRVVSRRSRAGPREWAISIGTHNMEFHAQKMLLRTALLEMETLNGAERRIIAQGGKFDARFYGLTQSAAEMACRRLQARHLTCQTLNTAS